jgi:hypothetical protein
MLHRIKPLFHATLLPMRITPHKRLAAGSTQIQKTSRGKKKANTLLTHNKDRAEQSPATESKNQP